MLHYISEVALMEGRLIEAGRQLEPLRRTSTIHRVTIRSVEECMGGRSGPEHAAEGVDRVATELLQDSPEVALTLYLLLLLLFLLCIFRLVMLGAEQDGEVLSTQPLAVIPLDEAVD